MMECQEQNVPGLSFTCRLTISIQALAGLLLFPAKCKWLRMATIRHNISSFPGSHKSFQQEWKEKAHSTHDLKQFSLRYDQLIPLIGLSKDSKRHSWSRVLQSFLCSDEKQLKRSKEQLLSCDPAWIFTSRQEPPNPTFSPLWWSRSFQPFPSTPPNALSPWGKCAAAF